MTKLMEWLLLVTFFFSMWIAIITENLNLPFIVEWKHLFLFFPVIVLFLFGLYAAIVVLYRVFTFNNCENAAIELQEQIEEAKKDLHNRGVILKGK
ncbi:dolichyl-phosphate mannosyltransferase subunit 3 [Xylocopa sonorina]|uniref:dolichyl-phosphate mannosyltransferase subunit 3 n=1 Tax=Xylocopa sonorina TaxID=1818115 RepID=UPI00403ADDBE